MMLATDQSTKIIEKNEEELEDMLDSQPIESVVDQTQDFSFCKDKKESPVKVIVDEGQEFEINNLGLIDKEMTD